MTERFVEKPNLPAGKVTLAAVSGIEPEIPASLERLGIRCIRTGPDPRLPSPVAHHADMQIFHVGGNRTFAMNGSSALQSRLRAEGLCVAETAAEPGSKYPADVLCNALYLQETVFANLGALDAAIYGELTERNVRTIHVNQGYARCAAAVVSGSAIITMDRSIEAAARFCGIDALYISEHAIRLDGYDWGLIGGCCGLIDKNVLAFTGALDSLESGGLIRDFLSSHGVTPVELTNRPMLDIGGILPLREIAGPREENGASGQK